MTDASIASALVGSSPTRILVAVRTKTHYDYLRFVSLVPHSDGSALMSNTGSRTLWIELFKTAEAAAAEPALSLFRTRWSEEGQP
jgi:hypothetical protein